MKHSLKDWIFATRFWSLTASSMPALISYSYIFYIRHELSVDIQWVNGIVALMGAVIFQIGGNLLNDYFDHKFKVDRKDTFSSRILVDNLFTPRSIYWFGLISLLVGCTIGIYLLLKSGLDLLWIGALGFLGSYFYYKLKYIALGDLNIFMIYGILIGLGIAYVMTGLLMWESFIVTAPSGLLIVGILHANNTRDILNDGEAGIKTQAMKLGVNASKRYFSFLIYGAYLGVSCLAILHMISYLSLLVFISLPIAVKCVKQMNNINISSLIDIKTLNESVAKLVMLFSILLVMANFISGNFY